MIVVVLTTIQFVLPDHSRVVGWYNDYIFKPFQSIRNFIFGFIPFSVGDLLYIVGITLSIFTLGKWGYYTAKMKTHKHKLALSFMQSVTVCGIIYIVFLLGWGGNYYKSSLSEYWRLPENDSLKKDEHLASFDRYLINELNRVAVNYNDLSFKEIDKQAKKYYKEYTSSRLNVSKAKPSIFGNTMQYVRIQGYYNPFTGEAQVNKNLPSFMLPFVICHEMAHQQGIAREDDANLLAYALGTATTNASFRYSAYFNVWLYTHRRLRMQDSSLANELKASLNERTQQHIQELITMREKYASDVSEYSADIYDGYLKLHHQNEGIRSYSRVWYSAWALEEKRKTMTDKTIMIP